MKCNALKKKVSLAVLDYIPSNSIIGIGSGTTILHFVQMLYESNKKIIGAISSSFNTTVILKKYGFKVYNINTISEPIIYIDSADVVDQNMHMIKGGGGALTKEKILVAMCKKFICIIDETKLVNVLSEFPVPIEIIPNAYSYVYHQLKKMGGNPKYRKNYTTENGNIIFDVHNLNLSDPINIENILNSLVGVVTVGLFANRKSDILLIGTQSGINVIQ
ncbi:ribose-5-phosphate isomerase RpiA [Buchnera aphidicola]|uniref:ribose-5-phosphate isomerase RpiA n=1 Tax=Buchnera aphidicola TaxID=9 RepID=UPI0031B88EED